MPSRAAVAVPTEGVQWVAVSISPRVLIVGGRAGSLEGRLAARGYACETAPQAAALETRGGSTPDVVVLASTARVAPSLLTAIRKRPELRRLPVVIDGTEGWRASLQRLDVDAVAETFDALERHLAASLRARRLADHDTLVRLRLEILLELTRRSGAGVGMGELLRFASARLREALACERVAVLELDGDEQSRAALVDDEQRTPLELAAAPTLRKALETREPTQSDIGWVLPLSGAQRGVLAFVLKRGPALEREERDFLEAVGVALANARETHQQQQQAVRNQQALEDAYVERYRELVEANNRLRALDRKKNELLAVLSHDLRAPLNVLLGHAHLLLVDGTLAAAPRASAEAIQRTGRKVLGLVESLLEQQRGEDGRIVLFSHVFDVSQACQDAAGELQLLAGQHKMALRAEAPLSLDVNGDEQKIKQVLQNLITNALTHSRGATQVTVRAGLKRRPDGDVALIEVRDDGQVEDPNELLLAFERSKGLGLAICREFVERHGGEIWAEAPVGGGAVFSFTLPMARGQQPAPQPKKTEPVVLLVDDDPIFSRMATMGLAAHYRVELARDGDEAVEKARALMPDLIIMDVFMPNRDGLDALRELQSRPETEAIPVMLLSARPELPERIRPAELGAADFVAKPLPPSALLLRVQATLQRTRARAHLAAGPGSDRETGLPDHLGVATRLEQEIGRSVRYGRPLALAVLKPLTPPAGDVVRRCASVLRAELKVPDFLGHLGGGVFVAVLPETGPEAAQPVLGRLLGRLADERVPYRSRMLDVKDEAGGAEALLERLLG